MLPKFEDCGSNRPKGPVSNAILKSPRTVSMGLPCKVEIVASGFRWTEGPTWIESQRSLLFSDMVCAAYAHTSMGRLQVISCEFGLRPIVDRQLLGESQTRANIESETRFVALQVITLAGLEATCATAS